MASQSGQQIFALYILFNISRGIGNQTMNFNQLIERNMRNVFLTQNVLQKLVPDPFIKNQN